MCSTFFARYLVYTTTARSNAVFLAQAKEGSKNTLEHRIESNTSLGRNPTVPEE